jgi:hypothetical protein
MMKGLIRKGVDSSGKKLLSFFITTFIIRDKCIDITIVDFDFGVIVICIVISFLTFVLCDILMNSLIEIALQLVAESLS